MKRPLVRVLSSLLGASLLGAGALLGAGCVQDLGTPVKGLQSLAVTLVSPAPGMRGSDDTPLVDVNDVAIDIHAVDAMGKPFTEDLDVDVFLSFGGQKIGQLEACGKNEDVTPLTTIHLAAGAMSSQPGGKACATDTDCASGTHCVASLCSVHLTKAFGKANLWVQEHPKATNFAPRAYGASDEMTFNYPTIPDIQTPFDLSSPTALYCSPFNNAQVKIVSGTKKADGSYGQLVVTSVFADSYVVADTGALFDPATNTGGYNHLYVYSFGKPPFFIAPGRVLARLGGNVSKFVGFTELNFPTQDPITSTDLVEVPAPIVLTNADRPASSGQMLTHLGRLTAATVTTTARICPINTTDPSQADYKSWLKFNQFNLNYGDGTCSSFTTFAVEMAQKTLGSFDPLKSIGKTIKVTGMLRQFAGQSDDLGPSKTGAPTTCRTPDDCFAAGLCKAGMCSPGAPGDACVEGTCKNGLYSFWNIVPRDTSDISVIN